jgi:predicted nucleotidyltransferase
MQVISNKEALIETLHVNEHRIKSYGVKNVQLFGSFLTGNITPKSDIDLLVDFDEHQKTYDNLMELGFFLEDLLGRKVEIVTPQSLNKYIGPHIIKQSENVIR